MTRARDEALVRAALEALDKEAWPYKIPPRQLVDTLFERVKELEKQLSMFGWEDPNKDGRTKSDEQRITGVSNKISG